MEEEAECGGNSDESLLKFLVNFGADYVFDIWADVGVEVLSELGESGGREEADEGEREKGECNKGIDATHFCKGLLLKSWGHKRIKERWGKGEGKGRG